MECTRLSVFLAQFLIGFVFAVPENGVSKRTLLAAKRLSLRSSDPLTRRSPSTHFMRFGRTSSSSDSGGDDIATKVNVKRQAYGLAAAADAAGDDDRDVSSSFDSTASPASSLTCVPDTETKGRIICYSPFNVSRHFLLVTERDGGDSVTSANDADDNDADDDDDNDDEGDDDGDDGDSDVSADEHKNDTRKGRARRRRRKTHDAAKRRLSRSATSEAEDVETFARLDRRRDNFIRLGRISSTDKNGLPLHGLGGRADSDLEEEYGSVENADEHGSVGYVHFGGNREKSEPQAAPSRRSQARWQRSLRAGRDGSNDETNEALGRHRPFSRYTRQHNAFMRLGRSFSDANRMHLDTSNDRVGARVPRRHDNFMRLGRSGGGGNNEISRSTGHLHNADNNDDDKSLAFYERSTRRHGNFMRLGRNGGSGGLTHRLDDHDSNLDLFRETRRRDSFLRLGRNSREVKSSSQVCGLPADALTSHLVNRLVNEDRATANKSTDSDERSHIKSDYSEEGQGEPGAYYESTVECLRRYMRHSTVDSPPRLPLPISRHSRADRVYQSVSQGGRSLTPPPLPIWPDNYRLYSAYKNDDDDDDDVYRIPAAAVVKLRI